MDATKLIVDIISEKESLNYRRNIKELASTALDELEDAGKAEMKAIVAMEGLSMAEYKKRAVAYAELALDAVIDERML